MGPCGGNQSFCIVFVCYRPGSGGNVAFARGGPRTDLKKSTRFGGESVDGLEDSSAPGSNLKRTRGVGASFERQNHDEKQGDVVKEMRWSWSYQLVTGRFCRGG